MTASHSAGELPFRYTRAGGKSQAADQRPHFMFQPAAIPGSSRTRLPLLAGFGAVLLLMGFAGFDAVRVVRQLQNGNREISQIFLSRNHALERIRTSVDLSAAVLREYLMASDLRRGERRAELEKFRRNMEDALHTYSGALNPEEKQLFAALDDEAHAYWKAVEPALTWESDQRRKDTEALLDGEVYTHRMNMLQIADRISAANEQELATGDRRSADLFQRFRWRLMIMVAVTLGSGLIVAGLSVAFILRLENESRLRYLAMVEAQEELKRLSARLVDAQESERRSISRELHDEIGQSLSALLVDLGNLTAITPAENPEVRMLLATAKKLAESSVQAVRNMALLLRPSMLDDLGLVPALHWRAREVSRRTGMDVSVKAENVSDELPEEHRTCVYRVVQEALHNCSQHAGARKVRIIVQQDSSRLLLTVEDDGRGFDAANTRGLGLLGMEERVEHLGGAFHVHSTPGRGTSLRVELPLSQTTTRAEVAYG